MQIKKIGIACLIIAIGVGIATLIYNISSWYYGTWIYVPNKGNIDAAGPSITNWFQILDVKGWDFMMAWLFHWDLAAFNGWLVFDCVVSIGIAIFLAIFYLTKWDD